MARNQDPTSTRTAVTVLAAMMGGLLAVGVLTIVNGSWFGLIAIVAAATIVPSILRARRSSLS